AGTAPTPAASATRSSTPRPYNRAATTPAATAADSGLLLRAGPGRARQADASPGPAAGVEPAVHGQQDPQPSSSPPRPHLILSRRHEYFDAAGRARVPPATAMPSHCPHPPPGRGRPADRRLPWGPLSGSACPCGEQRGLGQSPSSSRRLLSPSGVEPREECVLGWCLFGRPGTSPITRAPGVQGGRRPSRSDAKRPGRLVVV